MDRERGEDIRITPQREEVTPTAGTVGGVAPAAAVWPAVGVERIRWGAIWSGLLVAIASQMILSAFGLAIGLYSFTADAAAGMGANLSAVGIWTAIWGLISLFLGGLVAARLASSSTVANGVWHGLVVWALTLGLGTLLASLGVAGMLSYVPTRVLATPGIAPSDIISTAWGFVIGALLGLGAAIWGGAVGRIRTDRDVVAG